MNEVPRLASPPSAPDGSKLQLPTGSPPTSVLAGVPGRDALDVPSGEGVQALGTGETGPEVRLSPLEVLGRTGECRGSIPGRFVSDVPGLSDGLSDSR